MGDIDLNPSSPEVLDKLKTQHPDDYVYLRDLVDARIAPGARSTPVQLPEEWSPEHKERMV
jgi:hypothetical protein